LIEVLIRQYELQNAIEENRQQREQTNHPRDSARSHNASKVSAAAQPMAPVRQATFAFYEADLV
jgi:hypothetical protein